MSEIFMIQNGFREFADLIFCREYLPQEINI